MTETSSGKTANPMTSRLHGKIQYLLENKNEILSSGTVMQSVNDFYVRTNVEASPDRRNPPTHASSSASISSFRQTLPAELGKMNVQLAQDFLAQFKTLVLQVDTIAANIMSLSSQNESLMAEIHTTELETAAFLSNANALQKERKQVMTRLQEVADFLSQYQLEAEEITVLREARIPDQAFFTAFSRLEQVRQDCQSLDHANSAELLDQVSIEHERAIKRLYEWVYQQCCDTISSIETERGHAVGHDDAHIIIQQKSGKLAKALVFLKAQPAYFQHCQECIVQNRRTLIVRQFITALTRGSANQNPIEIHAHEPATFTSSMLGFLYECVAGEHDLITALGFEVQPGLGDEGTFSVIGQIFEGVARPLEVCPGRLRTQ